MFIALRSERQEEAIRKKTAPEGAVLAF